MANDLTSTNDQAAGRPDLATKALSLLSSTTDRIMSELGSDAATAIDAAIAQVDWELQPVPTSATGRSAWESAMHERLRRLAVKVSPTASEAQTKPWQDSMAEAFSDLPAMIALTAAKRAIHTPFRFIGDVEIEVRRIANELAERRRERLRGLRRMQSEVERAMRPAPALPVREASTPTPEELRRTNAYLRSIGLGTQLADDGSTYQAPSADVAS